MNEEEITATDTDNSAEDIADLDTPVEHDEFDALLDGVNEEEITATGTDQVLT